MQWQRSNGAMVFILEVALPLLRWFKYFPFLHFMGKVEQGLCSQLMNFNLGSVLAVWWLWKNSSKAAVRFLFLICKMDFVRRIKADNTYKYVAMYNWSVQGKGNGAILSSSTLHLAAVIDNLLLVAHYTVTHTKLWLLGPRGTGHQDSCLERNTGWYLRF